MENEKEAQSEEVVEEEEGEDGEKKNFEGLHGWIAHTHTRLQLALPVAVAARKHVYEWMLLLCVNVCNKKREIQHIKPGNLR